MSERFSEENKKSNINLLDDMEFENDSDDLLLENNDDNKEKKNIEYVNIKKQKSNFIRNESLENISLKNQIKNLKEKNEKILENYRIQNENCQIQKENYIKLSTKLKIIISKNLELIKTNDKYKKKILDYKKKYIKVKKRESIYEDSNIKLKLEQKRMEYNSNVNNIFYTNEENNGFQISSYKKNSENDLKIEKDLDLEFICKTKNNIDYFQTILNDNLVNKFEKEIKLLKSKFEKKIFNLKKIIERYRINLENKEQKFRSFTEKVLIFLQKTKQNNLFDVLEIDKNEKCSEKELESLFLKSEKKLNNKNMIISSIKILSNSEFLEKDSKKSENFSDVLKASNTYLEIGSENDKEESGNPLFKKQQEKDNKKIKLKNSLKFDNEDNIFPFIEYLKEKNKQKMFLLRDIGLTFKSKFERFLEILEFIMNKIENEEFDESLNSEIFSNEYIPKYLNEKNNDYFEKLDLVTGSYLAILDYQIKKRLLEKKFKLLRLFFGVIRESKIFDKKIRSGILKKIEVIGETLKNKEQPNFKKINEDLDYLEEKFLAYLNMVEGENTDKSKNLKNIKKTFNRSLSDNMLIAKDNLNFQKKMEDFFVKFFKKKNYINNTVKIQEQIKLDYKKIDFLKISDEKFLNGILQFFFKSVGKIVNKKKFRLTDKSMQNQINSFSLFFKKIRKILCSRKNEKKEKNLVLEDFDNVFENEIMLVDFLGNLLNKFILNK